MDTPDENDRVAPLAVPEPDSEGPLPIVLAKDGTVVLSYVAFVARRNAHVLLSFHVAFAHRFGPRDRRAPKRGAAFEVKESAWVRDSCAGKGKHYVLVFRDAVFECAAEGYGTEIIEENDDVVRLMARRLYK